MDDDNDAGYTQREWDRVVGLGKVPCLYSTEIKMDSAKALEMDYLLCDILKITMEKLKEVPLPIVVAWRKTASNYSRDLYEEESLMNSITFNTISVLSQEIETIEFCRKDKDDIEYKVVLRWLNNRIIELENE
tara:strand:+ start:660 stop:1058 length:399 start_codon:yes stop_codon:yes gene_type:complete